MPFIACGRCLPCAAGRFFECQDKRVSGVDTQGGFAEYVVTGSRETLRLPRQLDLQAAALVEPLAVGIHAARVARVVAGDRVLIIGAGPIGLTTALWCRFFGARAVVVSEPAACRGALAQAMGATAVLRPDQATGAEGLLARFLDAAGGPPDVIFECVGAPGLLQQCIEMAPYGGRVVPVGVCEQQDSIMPFFALVKELNIQFAMAYTRDDFETCVAMLGERRIDVAPLVTDIVSLDELPPAFEALRFPDRQCKVLVHM
jgi:(R,R)-butanediol dehydrogenase/meso-butanediol dehydrogenase/diacetyl reductase